MVLKLKAKIMSEENITKEALELVQEAQSAKVFNLADAIKGRAYPTTSVKVYLDDEAAMQLVHINNQMNRVTELEEMENLQAIADGLAQKIMSTALTFDMRGIGQNAIELVTEKINAKYEVAPNEDATRNPGWMKDYITTLVAMNIVSVTDSNGAVDDSEFTFEKVEALRGSLAPNEWAKLVGAMQKLTLAGGYFDQLTDAGFLQKS
jgi:hypothetical protein